jgi:hypothetical protein
MRTLTIHNPDTTDNAGVPPAPPEAHQRADGSPTAGTHHRAYLREMLARRETGVPLYMGGAPTDTDGWLRLHLQALGGLAGQW